MNRFLPLLLTAFIFGIITNNAIAQTNESLRIESMPHYDKIMQDDEFIYHYIFLEGKEKKKEVERIPLHLSLVIDHSGSMSGSKLEQAKKAMHTVVDMLTEDDLISIVSYESDVNVLVNTQPVKDLKAIHDTINTLSAKGGTNMHDGIQKGFELLNNYKDNIVNGKPHPYYLKRVLLLSDGLAGKMDEMRKMTGDQFSKNALSLSTFGIGADFNENLMTSLAKVGGGNYYFVEKENEMAKTFSTELNEMFNVCGRETTVELEFDAKSLACDHVFLFPYKVDGNKVTVQINDIFAKQQKAIIYRFKRKSKAEGYAFNSNIFYLDARESNQEISKQFAHSVATTADQTEKDNSLNEFADQGLALQLSGEHFQKAMDLADSRSFDESEKELKKAITLMDEHFERVKPHPFLKEVYESMVKYQKDLKKMKKNKDKRGYSVFQKRYKSGANRSIACPSF